MPGNHVEGGMLLGCTEETAIKLSCNDIGLRRGSGVVCEGCYWGLEITCVGETIRANWAKLRELKVPSRECFQDIATDRASRKDDAKPNSTRNDKDLQRTNVESVATNCC